MYSTRAVSTELLDRNGNGLFLVPGITDVMHSNFTIHFDVRHTILFINNTFQ